MSLLLLTLVPLLVTVVAAGAWARHDGRPHPQPRELIRRALVVLPSHGDQRSQLRTVLRALDTDPRVDVVVVESRSGTPAGTDELSERVSVLYAPDASTATQALQAGAARGLAAGYDAIIELPSRNSAVTRRITALLEALDDGAHVAVGSRYVPGGRVVGCSRARRAAHRTINTVVRWCIRAPVNDVIAHVRAYRREAIERALLPASGAGGAVDVEVMHRCRRHGLTVAEVPVTVAGAQDTPAARNPARQLLGVLITGRRQALSSTPHVIDLPEPMPLHASR